MAIVLPSPTAVESNEVYSERILVPSRPAIVGRAGTFQTGERSPWAKNLEEHRATLENAIRAVARVEGNDPVLPFYGTALHPMRYGSVAKRVPAAHILPLKERSPDAFGTRGSLLDRTAGVL